VNAIFSVLNRLNEKAKKTYSVAILTGYSAQLKLLKRRLASESNHWNNLTVECNTVDAFQGSEADIVLYSVTRSNKKGKVGFLRQTERMNVALSRGKIALVIVGDHYFCRHIGLQPFTASFRVYRKSPARLHFRGGSVMNSEQSSTPVNTPEQLAEWIRLYDKRSGFDLVSCQEVGLPVYKITVQALTQIRKEIPPIEEYVLKAIHAGLSSEQDIAGFLGLELPIVQDAMTNLRMSEDIDLIAPTGEMMQVWQVTKKGEKSLVDARRIVPEERTFTINFDGLLGKVRWYGRLEKRLLKARDVKNSEMIEIKPCAS
jgi:hypothetical protein